MKDIGYEKTAHLYDLFGRKPDLDFYYSYAREAGEALDIGAGTGLVAIPLAEKGIKVFCVEPSEAMRKVFLMKVRNNPHLKENLKLIAADAASFDADQCFDFCFLSLMFDHFLTNDERIESLTNITRHLNPGGKLVFDVYFGYEKDEELALTAEIEAGDVIYKRFIGGKVQGKVKEYIIVSEIWKNDKLEDKFCQKSAAGITNRKEIHDVLNEANLEVATEYSDYVFTPYQDGNELLVVEAVKKEER